MYRSTRLFECGQKEKPALVYHVLLPGAVGKQEEREGKKYAPGYCRTIPSIPAHARGQKTWGGAGGGGEGGREREIERE